MRRRFIMNSNGVKIQEQHPSLSSLLFQFDAKDNVNTGTFDAFSRNWYMKSDLNIDYYLSLRSAAYFQDGGLHCFATSVPAYAGNDITIFNQITPSDNCTVEIVCDITFKNTSTKYIYGSTYTSNPGAKWRSGFAIEDNMYSFNYYYDDWIYASIAPAIYGKQVIHLTIDNINKVVTLYVNGQVHGTLQLPYGYKFPTSYANAFSLGGYDSTQGNVTDAASRTMNGIMYNFGYHTKILDKSEIEKCVNYLKQRYF